MPENMFCSKCGAQNSGAGQFCQKCGATLGPVPAAIQTSPSAAPAYARPPVAYVVAPASPYGGFWIRFLAYFIDRIIVGIVAAPLFLILVLPAIIRISHQAEQNQEPSPEMVMSIVAASSVYVIIAIVGQWLYEALLTSSTWQGTIGKRVLRLKVTDEAGNPIGFGRATGRFFGKLLSGVIMDIGFIMIAFTDRKRGLHDMLAGTLVMKY
jgi:uncharacterized RDD family membrane protein YckC